VVSNEALARRARVAAPDQNQYKAGLIAWMWCVQATALSNERTVLTLLQSRLVASVQLIAALGGGWDGQRRSAPRSRCPRKMCVGMLLDLTECHVGNRAAILGFKAIRLTPENR
jgi:hypothetical protein